MSRRRRRRRGKKIIVPVASMGDIAFLLIIFFMVCSNFAKEAGISVEPPRSIEVEAVEESRFAVSVDADGAIYYQGRKIGSAKVLESDLADALKDVKTDQGRTVQFRCDRSVDKSVFEPVMDAIAAAGGRIAAVGERKKSSGRKQQQ
ncbi:biopolymer transporter ExbD [bacterium]|nr:biopolymer transporter ExbD [bacterium]